MLPFPCSVLLLQKQVFVLSTKNPLALKSSEVIRGSKGADTDPTGRERAPHAGLLYVTDKYAGWGISQSSKPLWGSFLLAASIAIIVRTSSLRVQPTEEKEFIEERADVRRQGQWMSLMS